LRQPMRGDQLCAKLVLTGTDFPWLTVMVRPADRFEGFRPLVPGGLRRLNHRMANLTCGSRPAPIRQAMCLPHRTVGQCLTSSYTSTAPTLGGG
jgi:hypothetical protein